MRLPCMTVVAAVLSSLVVLSAGGGRAQDRGLAIMEEQRRINSGYRDELIQYKMTLVNAKGERIPDALLAKIDKAHTFNQGFSTVETQASAIVDMKLHLQARARSTPRRSRSRSSRRSECRLSW